MSDYFVDYTAFIDERKRPENFPHQVHVINILRNVQSIDQLKDDVNKHFLNLVTSAGLVVMKDPSEPVEQDRITFDKRFFVPWHMLTHMQVDVSVISPPPNKGRPQDLLVPPKEEEVKPDEEQVN